MQGNDEVSLDLRQERKQNYFAIDVDTWTFQENKRGGRHHSEILKYLWCPLKRKWGKKKWEDVVKMMTFKKRFTDGNDKSNSWWQDLWGQFEEQWTVYTDMLNSTGLFFFLQSLTLNSIFSRKLVWVLLSATSVIFSKGKSLPDQNDIVAWIQQYSRLAASSWGTVAFPHQYSLSQPRLLCWLCIFYFCSVVPVTFNMFQYFFCRPLLTGRKHGWLGVSSNNPSWNKFWQKVRLDKQLWWRKD